jgi:quinol monooxygenase YgiN
MTVKAIVELTLQPGRRDEFVKLLGGLMEQHQSMMRAAGWHGSALYEVVDHPDRVVEIADWESVEARDAVMQGEAMAAFAPVFELLAVPFSATLVTDLRQEQRRLVPSSSSVVPAPDLLRHERRRSRVD